MSELGRSRPNAAIQNWQESADSVEKVEISDWNTLRLAVSSEPIRHVEWLFGSALTVAAWLVG